MKRAVRALFTLVIAFACAACEAAAVVKQKPMAPDDDAFPKPAIARKQVRFWEKVFGKFPSTTVIVHESADTDRIIDIIDYRLFAKSADRAKPVPRKDRDVVTTKYVKRYTKAVERFAAEGESATRHGAIEKRLLAVYRKDPASLKRLLSGELKIRAQTGLSDDFLKAATTAQAYLPAFERTFRQYGVPVKLTRLPFVESMFNLRARSKVGASGIWQFMPDTARNYIYVNGLVDERNAPLKATRAAAQFLLENYRDLKAWPLAITAYNHGKAGMMSAVKKVGTRDIAEIIKRYDSPSYGFASRNFYAEFLAASNVYDRLLVEGKIGTHSLPDSESILLEHPLTLTEIMKHTQLTKDVISDYNACILESTFDKYADRPLPPYFELRVPRTLAPPVKTALSDLTKKRYARK